MTNLKEEVKRKCMEGLRIDGGHHKQAVFEEILEEVLGYDLKKIAREMCERDYDYDNDEMTLEEYWDEYNYDGLWWEKGIP